MKIPKAEEKVKPDPVPKGPSVPGGLPIVRLKAQEDRRIRRGHLWIFSNEMEKAPDGLAPGALVEFWSSRNERLGVGYYNARSLIAGRILDRRETTIDGSFFAGRLHLALSLRKRFFKDDAYRWVHGESDDVPGLVIDRYGDVCVVESFSAGIDALLPRVVEALKTVAPWKAIVLRNDAAARRLEGLPEEVRVLDGAVDETHWFTTDGMDMAADVRAGQKTGFFFDQRMNRAAVAAWADGRSVLDVFCHTGGFGHACAKAGAARVMGVDSSAAALDLAGRVAQRNGWADRCLWRETDAFDFLAQSPETHDIVVLDPPRFSPTKKNVPAAIQAYIRLNALGMKRVTGGGLLATASCSQHVGRDEFRQIVARAAHESGRKVKIVYQGGAGPDHPVRPAMPETDYLKFLLLHVG
jgi:23S rRNA (cytosine1962-C5)-methyltransferase